MRAHYGHCFCEELNPANATNDTRQVSKIIIAFSD